MIEDRSQMMFDILLGAEKDLGLIKREQLSQCIRVASIEEHVRGMMTPIYGLQADAGDPKVRVDGIERTLESNEAEH